MEIHQFCIGNTIPHEIFWLLFYSGLCTPVTLSIFVHLLMNNPDDSKLFCGVLISVRYACGYVVYLGLYVSFFFR